MVTAGNLGVKTGLGFYDYSEGVKQKKVAAAFASQTTVDAV
jgi:3-hydroxyacyl-CoA dehydrogenase